MISWFVSVVVITSALHAEGPQFEPGQCQMFFKRLFKIFNLINYFNIFLFLFQNYFVAKFVKGYH